MTVRVQRMQDSINKAIAGLGGSTAPGQSIMLYRGAFQSEEQLAKALSSLTRPVTWLSREKAVATAVMAHISRHGPEDGPMGIRDLVVVDTGPVARAQRGAMILERTDLTDRMEF